MFNRGKILNIGYDLYKTETEYIITQDVDVNPLESYVPIYNTELVDGNILGIFNSPCETLGGITKITTNDFAEMNGFQIIFGDGDVKTRI